MKITLPRSILLSGVIHSILFGAIVLCYRPGSVDPIHPRQCQVRLVRRDEVRSLKIPKPLEKPVSAQPSEPLKEETKKVAVPAKKTPEVNPSEHVDLDMTLAREASTPVTAKQTKPIQTASPHTIQVAGIDLDMNIVKSQSSSGSPPVAVKAVPRRRDGIISGQTADYLSVSMNIAPDVSTEKGTPQGKNPGSKTGGPSPVLSARTHVASLDHISMTLETSEKPRGLSGAGGSGSGQGLPGVQKRTGKPVSANARYAGGIEVPVGLIGGEGSGPGIGRGAGTGRSATPSSKKNPNAVTMMRHKATGQIPLGTPLAFRLADVNEETLSGSAYVSRSTQLKRFFENHRLPSAPVTVSIAEQISKAKGTQDLVAVSYSSTQIIIQFESGKQQVITLVVGEPYPRFELRLASSGSHAVAVGTKLEEITSCLQTLQHIIKE